MDGWKTQKSRTASAVEETVSGLDSVVDLVSAGLVGDLPEAKAHKGHVIAAVQLDGGSGHGGWIMGEMRFCLIERVATVSRCFRVLRLARFFLHVPELMLEQRTYLIKRRESCK